jgi:hypothetical protein
LQQSVAGNTWARKAETTGEDNFKTVKLVWTVYDLARENKVIILKDYENSVNMKITNSKKYNGKHDGQ